VQDRPRSHEVGDASRKTFLAQCRLARSFK
jgi:hypothetical protein